MHPPPLTLRELQLDVGSGQLSIAIATPPSPPGLVIIPRGNGSGHASPPHQASFPMFLLGAGLAVAACDVLTPQERQASRNTAWRGTSACCETG